MKKFLFPDIPAEHKEPFIKSLVAQSAARMRVPLVVIIILQALQLMIYLFSDMSIYKVPSLFATKLLLIVVCTVVSLMLLRVHKRDSFFERHGEMILLLSVGSIILTTILNTFIAQHITSDISIYILAIFASASIVRLRPWRAFLLYIFSYIIFAVGIPVFQSNPEYALSHLVNGLILTLLAFIISRMFFNYSLNDYLDKQFIEEKSRALERLAERDGLTELYNHRTILELLESEWRKSQALRRPLTLLMLDLDHFKSVNDRFGHRTGDRFLKESAELIRRNIREKDYAGRYGGDEFMIVFPGLESIQVAEIAKRILFEFREKKIEDWTFTCSCGIAVFDGVSSGSVEQLIEEADRALYAGKKNGKDKIVTYTSFVESVNESASESVSHPSENFILES